MVSWGAPHAERADAARNRRHLLVVAREMLAEHGADKLTMDGLAERTGLGKGTVFRRFGTRAGIFAELLDDDERAFQQHVLARPPAALPVLVRPHRHHPPGRRTDRAKLAGPGTACMPTLNLSTTYATAKCVCISTNSGR